MPTSCSWRHFGLLIVLAGIVGCGDPLTGKARYSSYWDRGFCTATGEFGVSGGHIRTWIGKHGVTFGTLKKPNSSRQLTYVILFKLPATTKGVPLCREGQARAHEGADVKSVYMINGKRIEAKFEIELNKERTAVTKEKLTVGGKEIDPSAGRLFVLDLTSASPAYQQKNVALPDDVPSFELGTGIESYAETLLKHVQEKEPELKDWLK